MKSPFPGMDPYLEAHWGDVHTSLVTYARDQLSVQMPGQLVVRVEEYITVQVAGSANGHFQEKRQYVPDARVVENPQAGMVTSGTCSEVALAEPLVVPLQLVEQTLRSIRVFDTRSGNRLVTGIEFLSHANKIGRDGKDAYRKKQQEMLRGEVNLVEIDLLREGQYLLAAPSSSVPDAYLHPYRICVVRAVKPDQAEMYRVPLQERLPAIRIPLRETDPDARLDLQALIEKCYENGGYDRDIDYRLDPTPPLQGDDVIWADKLLREQGKR